MADEATTVNLKVLSPSSEVEGSVTLSDLPASTTIKELKSRIQDAVVSNPAPERMRLIYRGRVVANDSDTLENVLGADNLRENKDQSMHMVIRELPFSNSNPPSSTPRLTTAPPNPFRPAQPPLPASPLQTNPFRTVPQPQPQPQPQSQSQPQPQSNSHVPQPQPHHHHLHAHHHQLTPVAGIPLAIPVPPHIQQQFTQALAQNIQAQNIQAHAQHQHQPRVPTPGSQERRPNGPTPLPPSIPSSLHGPFPGMGSQNIPGRTVRQEGVGPNGERWSVTYNEVNLGPRPLHAPALPQPSLPPNWGVPPRSMGSSAPAENADRILAPFRSILDRIRRDMHGLAALFQLPEITRGQVQGGPPARRHDLVRERLQLMSRDLDTIENSLTLLADHVSTRTADVATMRQSIIELRTQIEGLNRMLDVLQRSAATGQSPSSASNSALPAQALGNPSTSTTPSPQANLSISTQSMSPDTPPELFILSSPQGPVGVLFDQQGTFVTAPMAETLPFETFTDQFARNRRLVAGLGQHIAHGSGNLQNQLANIQRTPLPTVAQRLTGEGEGSNQAVEQPQNHNQQQNQPQEQVANGHANQPAANVQGANAPNDMANVAGHLWLLLKLACFVYFFSGGASFYRMVMLGAIALMVYFAQIGMFDSQFNLLRHHFEALLPAGALADHIAPPRQANGQQPRAGGLTPEQAAQRILQQRREQRFGWLRDGMRTLERGFALFAASLWPGVGERMVHAQEERLRLERVAASEERERQEEARRQEVEAQQQREEGKGQPSAEEGQSSVAEQGEERVDAHDEGSASVSASTS